MELAERRTALGDLNKGVNGCHACALATGRTRAVPGEGPVDAEILLIGEGPGYYEDQQGRPFVGAAGQFLETLLASIGLKRTDVFIANVVKCRPPGNRDPLPEELAACSHWMTEQIDILQPKVVVTLGRYSLARFLPGQPIGKIHGQEKKVGSQWVMPMYHPAAALHQGSLRKTIEDDFKKIPAVLARARFEADQAAARPKPDAQPELAATAAAPSAPEQPPAEQGSLF
jgi:uracil-DNA glycosylase family 4